MKPSFLIAMLIVTASCAHRGPSYVQLGPTDDELASAIVTDAVAWIGEEVAPGPGAAIIVEPAEQAGNLIEDRLIVALRAAGYAVASPKSAPHDGRTLRFSVGPSADGVLAAFQLGDVGAARLYGRKGAQIERSALARRQP